jgi:predicted  nucleic acid-binding Zn-ribbon protein
MKKFLFEKIWLLSYKDQRARAIEFHRHKNLVVGRNHTGKSSLIKTLFRTLGAKPQGALEQWDENTISLVEFLIGQNRYLAIHQRGHRALFNDLGHLIIAASNHDEWTDAFSNAVGFNLVLTDKNSETVPADPRCFFLPFYINQDGSWQAKWDTFTGLQQYRAPIGTILEYFSGIKPPEFYELDSKKTQSQKALEDFQKEHRFLEKARDRFARSISFSGPKVQPENFVNEIVRLTGEVTELNRRQEQLRDKAVREQELLSSIKLQIHLAADALVTYESDTSYLRNEPREKLTCPTCGAEHAESFLELLNYAEDARVLRELVARLNVDASKVSKEYSKTRSQMRELDKNYLRVTEILEVRRGEFKFRDVVDSMGAERAFSAFEVESTVLKKEINQRLGEIESLSKQLKELTNVKRTKEILKNFREAYASALVSLNLPPIETSKLRLTSRPDLSGSGGPRSILAYYSALWRICLGEYASFSMPLVIDSPNQQGQDDINLPKVLKYIANNLPASAQIIVGTEMETNHFFDHKIVCDQPYKFLRDNEFAEVAKVVEPLAKMMYDYLQR